MNAFMNIQVRVLSAAAQARIRALEAELARLQAQTMRTGTAMNRMGTYGLPYLSKWGNQVQWAGRQLQYNFTLPILLAGAAATKFALDNEKAMTRVIKVYGDGTEVFNELSQTEIPALSEAFAELSNQFGVNQAAVINIAGDWAAAGASGIALARAVKLTLETMILGELEAVEATQALIAIQAQYGQSTEQLAKTIDILNMVENQTGISMAGLVQGMARAAGVARTAGIDVEHLAAMLAALTPAAGTAAQAGNGLKTIISRLLVPTKEGAEVLGLMGINIADLAWKSQNASQRLETMAETFEGLDDAQKAVVSSVIASRYQINRFDVLMRDITNTNGYYQRSLNATSDAQRNFAQRVKELNVVLESNPQRLKQVWTILQNALADIIVPLIPYIVYLASEIARLVRAFSQLDPVIQKAVLAGLVFLAFIGPVARYVGSIANLFGLLSAALHFFGAKFAAVGKIVSFVVLGPFKLLGGWLLTSLGWVAGWALRFPALIIAGFARATAGFAILKGWHAAMVAWWAATKSLWVVNFLFLKGLALRWWATMTLIWAGQAATATGIHTKLWASLVAIQKAGLIALAVLTTRGLMLVSFVGFVAKNFIIAWRSMWAALVAIHALGTAKLAAISTLHALGQIGLFTKLGRSLVVIWTTTTALMVTVWRGGVVAMLAITKISFASMAAFIVKWGKWLVSWPALVFFAILGVAYAFQDEIIKIWDNIVQYFTNSDGAIASAMRGIQGIFESAVQGISNAFWSLPSAITGAMIAVVRVIQAAAMAVYEWLSYLNPWATHSPSLVESVRTGMDEIQRQYDRAAGIGNLFRKVAADLARFKKIAASMGQGEWSEERTDIAKHFKAALPVFNALVSDWNKLNKLLERQNALLEAQQRIVDRWKKKLDAANAALEHEQDILNDLQDALSDLTDQYAAHEDQLEAYASAPLEGMGAMNEAIFQNEMAQKALRLEMLKWEQINGPLDEMQNRLQGIAGDIELLRGEANALRSAGAGSDITGPIEAQIAAMEAEAGALEDLIATSPIAQMQQELEDLQLQAEIMDLEAALQFGPLQHQIEQLVDTTEELTFEEIIAGIQAEQAAMAALQPQIDSLTASVAQQQAAVDAATEARDAIQQRYDTEAAKLEILQEKYRKTEEAIRAVEDALRSMGQAAGQAAQAAASAAGAAGGAGSMSPGAENFVAGAGGNFPDVGGMADIGREGGFGDQSALIEEFTRGLTDDIAATFGSFDIFAPLRSKWNDAWGWVKENVGPKVQAVAGAIGEALGSIGNPFEGAGGSSFMKGAVRIWDILVDVVRTAISWIKKAIKLFAPDVERIFDAIVEAGHKIWDELGPELKKWGKLWGPLTEALQNLWAILKPIIAIIGVVLLAALKIVATMLTQTLAPAFDMIIDVIENVLQFLRGFIQIIIGIFTADINMILDGLGNLFSGFFGAIGQAIEGAVKILGNLIWGFVKGIYEFFVWLYDVLIGNSIIPDMIDGIWKAFKGLINLGQWVWKNVVKPVWEFFRDLWQKHVGPEVRKWWDRLRGAWEVLKATGRWFWEHILKPIWDKFVDAKNKIVEVAENIRSGIVDKFQAAKTKVLDFVEAIRSIPGKIRDLASDFKAAGGRIIDAFVNGIANAPDFVSNIAGNVWNVIAGMLNAAIDKINEALEFTIPLPGMKDVHINITDIPSVGYLARGGIVRAQRGGSLHILGEGGYDEAVIPLGGPYAPKGAYIEGGVGTYGRGETHLHFYGDLSFPSIKSGADAEQFIKNLEILSEAS